MPPHQVTDVRLEARVVAPAGHGPSRLAAVRARRCGGSAGPTGVAVWVWVGSHAKDTGSKHTRKFELQATLKELCPSVLRMSMRRWARSAMVYNPACCGS